MDKLIVVDYQEGAGGEFMARFISAHFGHTLEFDQQLHPDNLQKYLNSYSLINPDWSTGFARYFQLFLQACRDQNIHRLAIPYHLYKYPIHVSQILEILPHTRFVKINCNDCVDKVHSDFQRKIMDCPIKTFSELQFLLTHKSKDFVKQSLNSWKQGKLLYKDLLHDPGVILRNLPSNDVEINYKHFFDEFDQTPAAYEKLCEDLDLAPNIILLSHLLERNKKNQQDLDKHLSKA